MPEWEFLIILVFVVIKNSIEKRKQLCTTITLKAIKFCIGDILFLNNHFVGRE